MQDGSETELLRLPDTGFLRVAQVLQFIPLGQTRWWQGVKTGEFPKPVKFSSRCVMWRAEDIRVLIRQLSERGSV